MLDVMRRHSRSLFIYLIFGILIAVFIISFGPQSAGSRTRGGGGCAQSSKGVAKVKGREISETSWRFALLATGRGTATGERARKEQIRERVMDKLVERELWAQAAEDAGFRLSDEEVRERIAKGEIYVMGEKVDGKRAYYGVDEGGSEPHFVLKRLESFARNLGLASVEQLIDEQRREMLGEKMRELMHASVRVSPEEVQKRYEMDSTNAEIDYVSFDSRLAADQLELTPAEIDAYVAAHDADLKKKYEEQKRLFTGRGKEVRLRSIFAKREAPPAKPPGSQPASQPAAPTPEAMPDPARARALAALSKLRAGQDFAAVARTSSEDTVSARKGGDLGWRPVNGLRLGAEVSAVVEKLQPGEMSDVIETPTGFYIVRVEKRREGDQSYDQVKAELGESALREERGKAAARAEAEKALAAAKAGTPLDKQFPAAEAPGTSAPPALQKAGPRLEKASGISRSGGFIPGLGRSPELVKALLDEMKVGDLTAKPYEIGSDLVVAKLTKRDEPDMEKFQKNKEALASSLKADKAEVVVSEWKSSRCRQLRDGGDISVADGYVTYSEEGGKESKSTYVPCTFVGGMTATGPVWGGIRIR